MRKHHGFAPRGQIAATSASSHTIKTNIIASYSFACGVATAPAAQKLDAVDGTRAHTLFVSHVPNHTYA